MNIMMIKMMAFILMVMATGFVMMSFDTDPKKAFISVQNAIAVGAIKLDINAANGTYSGECLDMVITNNESDSSYYWLEAGRRLDSQDSTTQDILVAREQKFLMAAHEKRQCAIFFYT